MKKKKSIKVWCERCLRWQVHKAERCPLFPKVPGVKKWSECVCTIHTCYDAKEMGIKRNKKNAPTYVDFAVEE